MIKKIVRTKGMTEILVTLMFFFSSLIVFQIPFHSMTFFIVFEIIFILYMAFTRKKLYRTETIFTMFYAEMFISAIFSYVGNLPQSYRNTAVYMTVLMGLSYICIIYVQHLIRRNIKWYAVIINAIKGMCYVQIGWCMIQLIAGFLLKINLNKVLFSDILHLSNVTTERLTPYGFAWHPAVLAPIMILSYYLIDSVLVKFLILLIAFTCSNATTLLGVGMCFAIDFAYSIYKGRNRIRSRYLVVAMILICIAVIVGIRTGFISEAIQKITLIWGRITGSVYDQSAIGHKRYFTAAPDVLKNSSLIQILFGYGTGCSGYPIDVLYNQYSDLSNWSVECDVMNVLYSWGIVGFGLVYGMLIKLMRKGWKINRKFTFFILILILEGITYNVQFEWVYLFVMFMYICVERGVDIWEIREKQIVGRSMLSRCAKQKAVYTNIR